VWQSAADAGKRGADVLQHLVQLQAHVALPMSF